MMDGMGWKSPGGAMLRAPSVPTTIIIKANSVSELGGNGRDLGWFLPRRGGSGGRKPQLLPAILDS